MDIGGRQQMKIDIYTLLGLVKDGKAPKKIKYNNIELEYSEENEDYFQYYGGGLFEYKFSNCLNFLNDEAEIIEETKKIEHCLKRNRFLCDEDEIEHLRTKIDELIDEINNLKKE